MNKNIFVALDFDNLDLALETTKKIRDEIAGVKVGTELYTICGNEGLKKIKELGVDIFLDLKLGPEIPNQVKKTVSALETLKTIKYLTIHTSGDHEMLNAAKEAAGSIELLGVTVLIIMFFIYRGQDYDGNAIGFSIHWWGILGLIGWVYNITAWTYFVFKKSIVALSIAFFISMILNFMEVVIMKCLMPPKKLLAQLSFWALPFLPLNQILKT